MVITERDEFIYDDDHTYLMAVHPNIQDVLIIGAGDGGVVRELARYDSIRRIDLAEMDHGAGSLSDVSARNASRLDDSRVNIYFDNALRFIRRCKMNRPDYCRFHRSLRPSEGISPEFYGICYNALHDDGILINQQGSPFQAWLRQ